MGLEKVERTEAAPGQEDRNFDDASYGLCFGSGQKLQEVCEEGDIDGSSGQLYRAETVAVAKRFEIPVREAEHTLDVSDMGSPGSDSSYILWYA